MLFNFSNQKEIYFNYLKNFSSERQWTKHNDQEHGDKCHNFNSATLMRLKQ